MTEIEPCYACGQPWQEPMMDARDAEDYRTLLRLTTETYARITGGLVSKPFTEPDRIVALVEERIDGLWERLIALESLMDTMQEVLSSEPASYDPADPLVRRHVAALVVLRTQIDHVTRLSEAKG